MVRKNKFDVVDFQNATLSGGVAVGAIADLMIQPGGAFIAGSLCGVVSTLGYRVIQVIVVSWLHIVITILNFTYIANLPTFVLYKTKFQGKLFDGLKLHDTCGVNNLHGMPGVISGLASILMVVVANEGLYGPRYLIR